MLDEDSPVISQGRFIVQMIPTAITNRHSVSTYVDEPLVLWIPVPFGQ